MNSKRLVVSLAALALVIASTQASAQEPPAGAAAQAAPAQAALTADGELVSVDVKANTITLKTATAPEMKFKFDDATKVTGGQKGVAGLATMAGSQVTIQVQEGRRGQSRDCHHGEAGRGRTAHRVTAGTRDAEVTGALAKAGAAPPITAHTTNR